VSLIQYHGEQSPLMKNHLTEGGLLKDCNEEYTPVLHLPLRPFTYDDGMYDVGIYRRWEKLRFELLPPDLRFPHLVGDGVKSKHVHGLIFNYGDKILVDSHVGSIYEGFDDDKGPILGPRVKLSTEDPVDIVVKRQFERIGDYCNFAYSLYEVEAHVYWEPQGEVRVIPMEITPYIGEIFHHFPSVRNAAGIMVPLFKALETIVARYEGI